MQKEKVNVCFIGPLPPPMTGLSKALDTILKSERCREQFNFNVIDLGKIYQVSGSKLSAGKITGFFRLREIVKRTVDAGSTDVYYLAIAQSTVGVLRDLMILHLIRRDKNRKNVIVHLHGGGFQTFYQNANPSLKKMIREEYSVVTKAVVLGESLRGMFEGILPDGKICIVPNCVDDEVLVSEQEAAEKADKILHKQRLQVLYLSNMIREKGYPEVLEAAKRCGEKMDFIFAGKFYSEAEKEEFLEKLKEEHLDTFVRYAGIVQGGEKKKLLKESDIFVLPTYYPHEGQPITIIEAMSAGMGVICTAHAGIGDLVTDRENALFVRAQHPEDICDALGTMDRDRELLRSISQANRQKTLAEFTEEKYITRMSELLGS